MQRLLITLTALAVFGFVVEFGKAYGQDRISVGVGTEFIVTAGCSSEEAMLEVAALWKRQGQKAAYARIQQDVDLPCALHPPLRAVITHVYQDDVFIDKDEHKVHPVRIMTLLGAGWSWGWKEIGDAS